MVKCCILNGRICCISIDRSQIGKDLTRAWITRLRGPFITTQQSIKMPDNHGPVGRKGDSILRFSIPCLDKRGHYIKQKLALEEVMSNPASGRVIDITLGDPRYPASKGWVKMVWDYGEFQIHWVYNTITHKFDDFKFKNK